MYSLAQILDWMLSVTLLESGTEIKVWILSGLWSVSGPPEMEVKCGPHQLGPEKRALLTPVQ